MMGEKCALKIPENQQITEFFNQDIYLFIINH